MVNTEDFINRLHHLLDFYSLSASAFADKISVQRSGLSHLLSGRNKPSLDFVMKIMEAFPQVNLYWLLSGKGSFLKADGVLTDGAPTPSSSISTSEGQTEKATMETEVPEETERTISQTGKNDIFKIVFFYRDGTFAEFEKP